MELELKDGFNMEKIQTVGGEEKLILGFRNGIWMKVGWADVVFSDEAHGADVRVTFDPPPRRRLLTSGLPGKQAGPNSKGSQMCGAECLHLNEQQLDFRCCSERRSREGEEESRSLQVATGAATGIPHFSLH